MKKVYFFLLITILGCHQEVNVLPSVSQEELAKQFLNPPSSAKSHTWWHWMNGNISKEGITADLEAMADAGIGGAQIFNVAEGIPAGPVRFNSPEWIDMVKHAHMEAKRLGIELCIHNCAGWSSSGGPWNTPENSMKIVVTSEILVKGPTRVTATPPQPETNLDFYRDIAILAFPTPVKDTTKQGIINLKSKIFANRTIVNFEIPDELPLEMVVQQSDVVDLTKKLSASPDVAGWDAPEGDWTILRVGYTSNGRKNHPAQKEGTGLECDKLSKTAVKAHWDNHVGLILDAIKESGISKDAGLNNVLTDSYEVGTQNWTAGFEKEFEKRTGYSIIRFMPVFTGLIVDSPEITERFLWDFRRVVADIFAEVYSEYFGKLAHDAGLLFSSEPYGNCPSDDIQYGSYCDIPMGEFWQSDGHSVDMGNAKLPASIAHVYGKKIIGAEAFTAAPGGGRWIKDPYALKAQGDASYCGGINRMIYHRYAHQPWVEPTRYPGMTMGQWGTHFERTLTWWHIANDWLTYQARCQYMLQEGVFVGDVLFYCGEGAPNELPIVRLPKGYDYDGCDTRALKMLKVSDGRLVLPSGTSYRMLVLPDSPVMSPEILETVGRLVKAGATVLGQQKPEFAPGLAGYPAKDAKVKKLANEIWPKLISGKYPEKVLDSLGVKLDFWADEPDNLRYIHRNINGMEVYFVACSNPKGEEVECKFRVSGKVPEFWHPETGEIETAPIFSEKDGMTTIPLQFDPSGSVFVVFREPVTGNHATKVEFTTSQKTQTIGELKILKAEYGYFTDEGIEGCNDVTDVVLDIIGGGRMTIHAQNEEMKGDPIFGVIKKLRIDYRVGGVIKREEVNESIYIRLPASAEVIKAYYGVTSNIPEIEPVRRTVDVTENLKSLVKNGELSTTVNKELTYGNDPEDGHTRKQIRVEYLFNNTRGYIKAYENSKLVIPKFDRESVYEMKVTSSGILEVQAWKAGNIDIMMADGSTTVIEVENVPEPADIVGSWQLSFPPGWGAPEVVTLDKLISWPEHSDPGVKYFSGTATYSKRFAWDKETKSNQRIVLDLGDLKNFAEITLNGKQLPLLWKPPYHLDVTEIIRQGDNDLQVKVTNLWPNRLIGDELLPDDRKWNGISLKEWPQWVLDGKPSPTGRYTFTTWHHWQKEDTPLPSGLFGPVRIHQIECIAVK